MTRNRVTRALISSGVAGAIALVIYVIIAAAVKGGVVFSGVFILVGAVLLGLFTFVVALVINLIISSIFARRS